MKIQRSYVCARCMFYGNLIEAAEVHHIFFGTANSKLSEKYNLKIPVCRECHNWAHNKNPEGGAGPGRNEEGHEFFCGLLEINYEKVNIAVNNSVYHVLNLVGRYLENALTHWEK